MTEAKRFLRPWLLVLVLFLSLSACQAENEVPLYGAGKGDAQEGQLPEKKKEPMEKEEPRQARTKDPYEEVNEFIDGSLATYRDLMVEGWNKELLELFTQEDLGPEVLAKKKPIFQELGQGLLDLKAELEGFDIPHEIDAEDRGRVEIFQEKMLASLKVLSRGNQLMLDMIDQGQVDSDRLGQEIEDMGDLLDEAVEALGGEEEADLE